MKRQSVVATTQVLRNRLAQIERVLASEQINEVTRSEYEAKRAGVVKALEALPAVCEDCGAPISSARSLSVGRGSQCRRKGAA
jgi:RNA polymerase-binding transcription factor DksA